MPKRTELVEVITGEDAKEVGTSEPWLHFRQKALVEILTEAALLGWNAHKCGVSVGDMLKMLPQELGARLAKISRRVK